jgi:hypothetical protein
MEGCSNRAKGAVVYTAGIHIVPIASRALTRLHKAWFYASNSRASVRAYWMCYPLFCFLTPDNVAAVAREGVAVAVLADPLVTEIESLGVMDDVDAIWRV